jgi:hypothetical protein
VDIMFVVVTIGVLGVTIDPLQSFAAEAGRSAHGSSASHFARGPFLF